MQFKTREFLFWIHLHSFDAIAIFDISYVNYVFMGNVNGQDQKIRIAPGLQGGVKVFRRVFKSKEYK